MQAIRCTETEKGRGESLGTMDVWDHNLALGKNMLGGGGFVETLIWLGGIRYTLGSRLL
jgi:hypothetical protein